MRLAEVSPECFGSLLDDIDKNEKIWKEVGVFLLCLIYAIGLYSYITYYDKGALHPGPKRWRKCFEKLMFWKKMGTVLSLIEAPGA